MKPAICTINFETTEMTNYNIRRIFQLSNLSPSVYVFDNSIHNKFVLDSDLHAKVFYNGLNQLFDINICMKKLGIQKHNVCIQHLLSIQWLLDNIVEDDVILIESDAIVKKNPIEVIDHQFLTCATPEEFSRKIWRYDIVPINKAVRFAPYFQYFNKKALIEYSIKYMSNYIGNPISSRKFSIDKKRQSDTGFYFFYILQKKNLFNKVKIINYTEYVDHLVSGSWRNKAAFNKYKNNQTI